MTVETIDYATGEVIELTEAEARGLTERIRTALDRVSTAWADLADRITEAYQRRADLALGYGSWAEYAEAELKPSEGLAAEVRIQLAGMIQHLPSRAAAPLLGVTDRHARRLIAAQVGHDVPPSETSPESMDGGIFSAVAAADSVYRTGAGALPRGAYPEVLDQSLSVITGAWRRDRDSAHQMVVQGTGQVIARFAEGVDLARFATVLSRQSPVELMVRARSLRASQGGTTAAALAKVLVSVYNNRLRTNLLPEWVWTR